MAEQEFKITKERILAASNACAQTKDALQILFPEAFEPVKPKFRRGNIIAHKNNTAAKYVYLGNSQADRDYFRTTGGSFTPDITYHIVIGIFIGSVCYLKEADLRVWQEVKV